MASRPGPLRTASHRPKGNQRQQQEGRPSTGVGHTDRPVLDQPRAAGEREQALVVGRVRAVAGIEVVVEHVGAGVRHQGQQQGGECARHLQTTGAGSRRRQAEQAGHRRHGEEGRAGHAQQQAPVGRGWRCAGRPRRVGVGWMRSRPDHAPFWAGPLRRVLRWRRNRCRRCRLPTVVDLIRITFRIINLPLVNRQIRPRSKRCMGRDSSV